MRQRLSVKPVLIHLLHFVHRPAYVNVPRCVLPYQLPKQRLRRGPVVSPSPPSCRAMVCVSRRFDDTKDAEHSVRVPAEPPRVPHGPAAGRQPGHHPLYECFVCWVRVGCASFAGPYSLIAGEAEGARALVGSPTDESVDTIGQRLEPRHVLGSGRVALCHLFHLIALAVVSPYAACNNPSTSAMGPLSKYTSASLTTRWSRISRWSTTT